MSKESSSENNECQLLLEKKREAFSKEIRSSKRQEYFERKRVVTSLETEPEEIIENMEVTEVDEKKLVRFAEDLSSVDKHKVLMSLKALKRISTVPEDKFDYKPPLQKLIDLNIVIKVMKFALEEQSPQIQIEAVYILSNLVAGTSSECEAVVSKGGIELFILLLDQSIANGKIKILISVIHGIGNIAGDNTHNRMVLLKNGVYQKLMTIIEGCIMEKSANEELFKNAVWAFSNLIRDKPPEGLEITFSSVPLLNKIILFSENLEIIVDSIWSLKAVADFYLKENEDHPQNELILKLFASSDTLPTLFKCLKQDSMPIMLPSLRLLNQLSRNSMLFCKALQTEEFLDLVKKCFLFPMRMVQLETLVLLTKLVELDKNFVELYLTRVSVFSQDHHKTLIEKSLRNLNSQDFSLQRDTAKFLRMCLMKANLDQIEHMVQLQLIEVISSIIKLEDSNILLVILDLVYIILGAGSKSANQMEESQENNYSKKMKRLGIVGRIEKLQDHCSEIVYHKSLEILETFFEIEENLLE